MEFEDKACCTKCTDGDKYDGPHACKAGEETRAWLAKRARETNADTRPLYHGALYEDVQSAVRMIVRSMRMNNGNAGKNTNMRISDRFMVHPEIVRLYDPNCTVRLPEDDWDDPCACDRGCCETHADR